MKIPLLISVPHAGKSIPSELKDDCLLTEEEIIRGSDIGADEIFLPLIELATALVTTDIARIFVDVNRAADDFDEVGVFKTRTEWNTPIYKKLPIEAIIIEIIRKYYHPYHQILERHIKDVKLGIDCHTAASTGPVTGRDPGKKRPLICISNANSTCPWAWLYSLANILERRFKTEVAINHPFAGGYIIRSHSKKVPWIQITISQTSLLTNDYKRERLLAGLKEWFRYNFQ